MALGIHEINHGRLVINLVNAWNRPEIERAGIVFAEPDARYRYGAEWLSVVKRLLKGECVTHSGAHFAVTDYALRLAIYLCGESEPARRLAATASGVWFVNG